MVLVNLSVGKVSKEVGSVWDFFGCYILAILETLDKTTTFF